MGITLVIVMSMLAFIINVGLFVKAKINLQNAADAAAFSGAATQSRQLTNIAYANWELRNTYKEWMFKYYVLGQLGLMPYSLKDSNISGNNNVRFILERPDPAVTGLKSTDFDKYNIPSICIHNNSNTNICPIYSLPGIPRFPAIGIAGISEIHEAFVNTLAKSKAEDCSRRSAANFLTALTWAFGSGKGDLPEAPLVAANRPGAWPEALELAFRIRNLEMIVNLPPVSDISLSSVQSLQTVGETIGLNERPIKAFWSAYRNLSGGAYKDNNTSGSASGSIDELSYNLKLTELAPQAFDARSYPVSKFLIPDTFQYPGANGGSALDKHYLDLQLMPVNLATMFSTFVDNNMPNVSMGNVIMESSCGISKTALPVPGYIMGYVKNPEVLTYYAVKAESKFVGLFYPITSGSAQGGITLSAYSAAKPFGGRIGPKLFAFSGGEQTVQARESGDKNVRSKSYVSGLSISGAFAPGMPIPSGSDFWVGTINRGLGGVPGQGQTSTFAIPNMIYDFKSESDLSHQIQGGDFVQIIGSLPFYNSSTDETMGLYHAPQFKSLKASLGTINPGTSMSGLEVQKAILRSRRPTRYDAINYLIPDFREVDDHNNAAPVLQKLNSVDGIGFSYQLFAPLCDDSSLLYKNCDQMQTFINQYIDNNGSAVDAYLTALLGVADTIFKQNNNTQADHSDAARSIHANAAFPSNGNIYPPDLVVGVPASDPRCKKDIASKFFHFFKKEQIACDIVPLKKLMIDFIAEHSTNIGNINRKLYYIGQYYNDPSDSDLTLAPEKLMTAYYPGKRQGTSQEEKGIAEHPLKLSSSGLESYSTRRNYYSTKFFHMAKVLDTVPDANNITRGSSDYKTTPILREAGTESPGDLLGKVELKNPLKYSDPRINNTYFLDF